MPKFNNYSRVIAIKEMADGNESVGTMWMQTKSFTLNTPIRAILDWASDTPGKLIITVDESTINKEE